MPAPARPEKQLTLADFSAEWAVHPKTVRTWVRDNKLRLAGTTPGGQMRFNRSDVEALFATGYQQ